MRDTRPEDIHLFSVMSGDVNPTYRTPEFARPASSAKWSATHVGQSVLISSIPGTEFPGLAPCTWADVKFWRPITIATR